MDTQPRMLTPREVMVLLLSATERAGLGQHLPLEVVTQTAVELLAKDKGAVPIPRIPVDGLPGMRYSSHIDSAMEALIGSGVDIGLVSRTTTIDLWPQLVDSAKRIGERYSPEVNQRFDVLTSTFVEQLRLALTRNRTATCIAS